MGGKCHGERRRKSGKRYLSVHTRISCHMFNFNMMNRSHGERIFPFSGAVYFPLFCHLPVLSVIFSVAFHPHNILNGFCWTIFHFLFPLSIGGAQQQKWFCFHFMTEENESQEMSPVFHITHHIWFSVRARTKQGQKFFLISFCTAVKL